MELSISELENLIALEVSVDGEDPEVEVLDHADLEAIAEDLDRPAE